MAANVFSAAMMQSRAEGSDRNVLMALADAAGHDGVTWLNVGAGKNGKTVDNALQRARRKIEVELGLRGHERLPLGAAA